MATRRVHNIAREIGIDSKLIVAKCQAEGISESVIKNHMSIVSAGLEATIREWFSGHAGATAVETAGPVDVEQVKAKPAAASKTKSAKVGKSADGESAGTTESGSSGSGTATINAPGADGHDENERRARAARKPVSVTATPVVSKEATPAAPKVAQKEGAPAASAPAASAPAPEVEAPPVKAVAAPKPVAVPRTMAMPAGLSATSLPTPPAPVKVMPGGVSGGGPAKVMPTTVEMKPSSPGVQEQRGDGGSAAPLAPAARGPEQPRTPVAPAPQNVPTRPKVVSPMGQKLQVQTPVKLSGPKVVRIEAPEQMPQPRSRPGGSSGPGGPMTRRPPGGGGVIAPGGGAGVTTDGKNDRDKRRSSGAGVSDRRKGRADQGTWTGNVFSEQDLAEREARLLRSSGLLKKRKQDLGKKVIVPGVGEQKITAAQAGGGLVRIAAPFTIKDVSAATGVKGADIVKKLFLQGIMATINSPIDVAKAQEIMFEFNIELEITEAKLGEEAISEEFTKRESVSVGTRGPVVTILGHVDHGKTSLLDKIRKANVAAGEAGGITQRTSAFRVPLSVSGESKEIVFFDTPGHQAFTEMRSRGANMTDIVVLVCSPADGGVMPQTIESISHAKAAKVPIVVALNKIDRPEATDAMIQKALGQLAEHGLNPIEWGGDTEVVRTSGLTGVGIDKLLETLDLQAQLLELKADFDGPANGNVIESRVEEGRGPVANILVRNGKLKVGDFIVAGRGFGRVRDMTDDRGNKLKEALPPMPVQISGLDEIPNAGDRFFCTDSLRKAQEAAELRRGKEREASLATPKVTLDSLFGAMGDKDSREILVVVKAAEQGTVDVLKHEIEKIKTDEIKVRVLSAAVGGITESDVILAAASKAIVVGFNVIASGKARTLADQKGVEIRPYQVIYHITDDLRKAAEGLLAPELRQEVLGHAEVRQVFKVSKVGTIAGCYVTDGIVQRDALIRVTRNDVVVENDRKLEQLKRFKDDAKEVRAGMECGMKIVGYDDIKEGDILECYKNVEVKRTL